jgi:predicted dehydrogenase
MRRDRRRFLGQVTGASALLLSARGLGLAEVLPDETPFSGSPVRFGVVGCGPWGREILATLAKIKGAQTVAVCDTYPPFLKKGLEIAPEARGLAEATALVGLPDVEAVVVATPSHRHREIATIALDAGKHVYCEAPLAHTLEDAKAIARAAQVHSAQVFQGGLQGRANALYRHVTGFVKTGVLGTPALVTARWSRKDSWRRAAPTPEREAELDWRLRASTSPGLVGEVGLHQIDLVTDLVDLLPEAVTGFGTTIQWKDKRDVADTAQCVLEYPRGLRLNLAATLASSAGGAFTLLQGSNASLMIREQRAWMIKEADSPLLGWEVYARKENVLDETGIALIADATKILAAGQEPGKVGSAEPAKNALWLALEGFVASVRIGAKVACGPKEAYQATAIALVANESISKGARLAIGSEQLVPS